MTTTGPILHTADYLASLVLKCERDGLLHGWRAYIWDQAKRAGISRKEMEQALERARQQQQ